MSVIPSKHNKSYLQISQYLRLGAGLKRSVAYRLAGTSILS
jgi:hypothetical protein